ncbi:glycosyltransferase [Marinobacter xiaoshiensis]|uniref:Glycosyltransferase n=1 Tax=Marinobacter xiaoshiensis TaxID=3073652 RepID=A0ABU2HH38_9GAMM|nr:glycosyltransferase [Marinobacter sp. F60267]MDS1309926.1 glycosyltransferase [Marinobacter sp. F60267]
MTVEESKTATKLAKKPLRVLHITFNMGIGGTEQVIRQLVQGMASENVESEILCIDGHIGSIGEALQQSGVPVHKLARKQGFDWALAQIIRKRLSARQFDVIHCHQYTPWVYGWLGALGTKAKVIFTEHGRFHPDKYRRKARLINPILARLTPAIVAISEATKNALVEYEYLPESKIQVIYNGIKPLTKNIKAAAAVREKLRIPAEALVIGTVSRIDPVKNQPMMLKAFKLLLNQHPSAHLLMVGDGPDKNMLMEMAKDLGLADNIIFTGFINTPVDYLAAMDIFLLSSHTEGTSMTLLESMSLGIPSVVTNVGGNPEIVEQNQTGLLTQTDQPEAFASAMISLAKSPKLRQSLGAKAQARFADRFSAKVMTNKYLELYAKH